MNRVILAPNLPASVWVALKVRLQMLCSTGAPGLPPCDTGPLEIAQTGTALSARTSGHSRGGFFAQRPSLTVRCGFLKATFAEPGHVLIFLLATPLSR
jgi:hypothetical protein